MYFCNGEFSPKVNTWNGIDDIPVHTCKSGIE
jgi:hypothetical protein